MNYIANNEGSWGVRRSVKAVLMGALAGALGAALLLPGLARSLGLGAVLLKDDGGRFGLGSFKALGGAYGVRRLLARL